MSRSLPDGLHLGRRDHGLVPVIAAVAAIAALALGGWSAAHSLSREWENGAAQRVTLEIPDVDGSARETADRLKAVLQSDPGIASIEIMPEERLRELLQPWLGSAGKTLTDLPVVLTLARQSNAPTTDLPLILDTVAPSTIVEENARWGAQLLLLGRSLQACAWLALLLAGFATAGVTTLSVRMTLHARRRTIEILHGFGATDSLVAQRIAWRSATLGLSGGIIGTLLGGATLAIVHRLIQPFLDHREASLSLWPHDMSGWLSVLTALPSGFFESLFCVPLLVAALSFLVALTTVHLWLRRLA